MQNADLVRLAADLSPTIVAVVALYQTFKSERRNHERFVQSERLNHERFEREHDLSRRVAEAHVRPILAIEVSCHLDRKALEVWNYGGGPAVITSFKIHRKKLAKSAVYEVLNLDRLVVWDDFTVPPAGTGWYLRAGTSELMIELTLSHLLEQQFSRDAATAFLEELETQLHEVRIRATYSDILGNVIVNDEEI